MTQVIKSRINSFKYLLKKTLIQFKNSNIKIGKNTLIDRTTKIDIRNNNKLIIGENVYLRSKQEGYHAGMPYPTTILLDGRDTICQIGDNCRINGCYIHAKKEIIIGENTVIAAGTNIIDSNGHIVNSYNRTEGRDNPESIIIGNNVWVGLNSIILKNTVIGENCIISAGSVVKGTFPANSIIQGNPGVVIKKIKINS